MKGLIFYSNAYGIFRQRLRCDYDKNRKMTRKDLKKFKYWAKGNIDENDYAADVPVHQLVLRPRPYKFWRFHRALIGYKFRCMVKTARQLKAQKPQAGYLTEQSLWLKIYNARCVREKKEKIRNLYKSPVKKFPTGYSFTGYVCSMIN